MRHQPELLDITVSEHSRKHSNQGIHAGDASWQLALDHLVILGLLFLLLFVSSSHAQQADKGDIADLSIEQLLNLKVLTASKFEQSASDAPSSVTVITRDDIQKYGYRNLADVLQSVRGFYITYDRNYSYLGVRGFQRPGDYNSRILLLIDGHRLNDNIYGQGYIGNDLPVDLDMIERIEIVRGATSSLYGTSAFFGVINLITRRRNDLGGIEVSFEPGSFQTYKGRASYGGEYKGVGLVLSSSFYGAAGQDLFFPEFNNPATNNGLANGGDGEKYQDFLSTITFRGFTLQGVFSVRDKSIPTGSFATIFSARPGSGTLDSHRYINLEYERSVHKWDVTASAAVNRHVYNGTYIYPAGDDSQPFDTNKDLGWGTWLDSELKLQRKLNRHHLTFGGEFKENLQADQVSYDTSPLAVSIHSLLPNSSEWSAYGEDEISITRKISVSAGARYDHYVDFGGSTNPRLGFIYHLSDPTTVKVLYGTAFRAPTPYELFYNYGTYVGNLKLMPESMKTFEVVLERRLGKNFLVTGDLFRNDVDDLITQQTNPDGSLQFTNSQDVASTGVEAEIAGRFAKGVQVKASYAYAPGEDEFTHQELSNSAHNLTKLNASFPLPRRMSLGLDAQYTGARKTLAGNTVGAFPVFNLTLLSHQFGNHADLSASVYNIFDRSHSDPALPDYPMDTILQDGRSFRVKLTWHSQTDSH